MQFLAVSLAIFILLFGSSNGNDNSTSSKLRILSYNVWYGFSKKMERKPKCIEYVSSLNPDIVALQELNGFNDQKLKEVAKLWGHSHFALLKNDGFPTGITSRYPLTNLKRELDGYHHGMLSCRVKGIRLYVVHLHPGHWEIRHREVDKLIDEISSFDSNADTLLVGDFNTFSIRDAKHYDNSPDLIPFFRRLDKRWASNRNLRNDKLDYGHLLKIEKAGFVDLVSRKSNGFLGTFPTKLRLNEDNGPSRRLDYFFASKSLAEKCTEARNLVNDKTDFISDHYPVWAEFENL